MIARVLSALGVLAGISVLVFLIFYATPGADPASRIAGRGASPETLAQVRAELGLDRPLPVQYARLMSRLFVTRDLESTVNRGQLVVPEIIGAVPTTLALAAGAALLWLAAGLAIGLLAALRPGGTVDRIAIGIGLLGVSIPAFWLGEVANLFSQDRWHGGLFAWVPPLGGPGFSDDPSAWLRGMVLPWLTLASLYAGIYGRAIREGTVAALRTDFVRTARAKGIGEGRVLVRHALRVSLASVVALLGLDLGALIGGGTLLTEIVFGLHGVGRLTYDALRNLDLAMLMGTVLYAALLVVGLNLAADLVQRWLDPRLR